jgi:hypothetical protein
MSKILRVAVVSVLVLLSVFMVEALVFQPVFADSVKISEPEYVKKWRGYRAYFNVTNDGDNTDGVYDFHVSVFGAVIKRVSKPKGWSCRWESKPTSVIWETKNKPIWNGESNGDFDILTDLPSYSGVWWTTNKEGKTISSGSFTVP